MYSYSLSQGITFEKQDIQTLNNLMNIELDADFTTNLTTDAERTKQMEKEILAFNSELKKPSEIKTLKIKNLLPDLSEALQKFKNKKIESNYKPSPIYYDENFELEVLSVRDYLQNDNIESLEIIDSSKDNSSLKNNIVKRIHPEKVEYIRNRVLEARPEVNEVKDYFLTPVVGAHSGPGAVAIGWIFDEE